MPGKELARGEGAPEGRRRTKEASDQVTIHLGTDKLGITLNKGKSTKPIRGYGLMVRHPHNEDSVLSVPALSATRRDLSSHRSTRVHCRMQGMRVRFALTPTSFFYFVLLPSARRGSKEHSLFKMSFT
jgi:hypothetical protein